MELTTLVLSDFVKSADVLFHKGAESVDPVMRKSGLVKEVSISEHTGNTREFSSVDTNEYLTYKGQGDQAARGQVQQGLTNAIALIKSLLINGENLRHNARATLTKLIEKIKNSILQVQRLSEERLIFISQATVRTYMKV